MTRSLVRAGRFHAALDATLVGLANSPEQKQRRRLYANLGDLKLALSEPEGAYQAYVLALKAVNQKGGAIDEKHFLGNFEEDSVGDFIAQVLTNRSESSDIALAIPSNYAEIRVGMLLRIGNESELERLSKSLNSSSLDALVHFGHECRIHSQQGTVSKSDILDRFEFCSQFALW